MRYAISLPQLYADGEFDPEAFRRYLGRAEELGFHSAWALEQTLDSTAQLSPLETMSFAAACTSQLRLGCAVFVSTLHSPVQLAKALASLDQLSLGRVEVGVGSGGKDQPFAAYGFGPDRYVTRFSEGISVMKALWTQERVSFDGTFWQLDQASIAPRPAQKPHPPLWFGGSAPAALRRAALHGDGFFGAGSATTAEFASQVQVVRQSLARPDGDFPIAKRVYVAIGDNAARARERMNDALERVYGAPLGAIEAAAAAGTAADCVREVGSVIAAGASLILFTALFDLEEQMERLAAEVIPALPTTAD
jgi:probable F420-dependent oxidoreductase